MTLRSLKNRGVNLVYRHLVPNRLAYLNHRLRHRQNLEGWAEADIFFIHIPKCAGTSFVRSLGQEPFGHLLYDDLPADLRRRTAEKPHVTILRDPVDRLASVFRYAHRTERTYQSTPLSSMTRWTRFDDYVLQGLRSDRPETHYFLRPASAFLEGVPRERLSIINFDRLAEGTAAFMKAIGRPWHGELPRENASAAAPDLEMALSDEAQAVIRGVYADDLRLWERVRPYAVLLSERLAPAG